MPRIVYAFYPHVIARNPPTINHVIPAKAGIHASLIRLLQGRGAAVPAFPTYSPSPNVWEALVASRPVRIVGQGIRAGGDKPIAYMTLETTTQDGSTGAH